MLEPVASVSTVIEAPAATVWNHLVGNQSALFPNAAVTSGWQPGDSIEAAGEWKGKTFHDYGEVINVVPGVALSFTHWSKVRERPAQFHEVRVALGADGDRTRVNLEQYHHGSFEPVEAATKAEFEKTWAMLLEGLKSACEA